MADSAHPAPRDARVGPHPAGGALDEISLPLVTIAVGCLLLLAGLFFSSFILLGAGLLVLLVGVVWRGVARRRH